MPFTKKYCPLCKKEIIENKFARHTRTKLHESNLRWAGGELVNEFSKIYHSLVIKKHENSEDKWKRIIYPHLNHFRLSENSCDAFKNIFHLKHHILSVDEKVDREILDVAINIMLIKHISKLEESSN